MGRGKSNQTIVFENRLIEIIEGLSDYHPLTVRQVYYKMVKNLFIENTVYQYQKVSRILASLRQENRVSWSAITDRHRRLIGKRGVANLENYVKEQCKNLFKDYSRCLVQQQENYVELWTEKDALAAIFEDVAWPYCIRVVVCKGQLSRTFLKDYYDRAYAAVERGLNPVILHGGDLDPTGVQIPKSVAKKLIELFGLWVDVDRFALTPVQIERYGLPVDFKAAKEADPNYNRFVDQFGTIAVELDALDPPDLEDVIKGALANYLDITSMLAEQKIQKTERLELKKLRRGILEAVQVFGYDI